MKSLLFPLRFIPFSFKWPLTFFTLEFLSSHAQIHLLDTFLLAQQACLWSQFNIGPSHTGDASGFNVLPLVSVCWHRGSSQIFPCWSLLRITWSLLHSSTLLCYHLFSPSMELIFKSWMASSPGPSEKETRLQRPAASHLESIYFLKSINIYLFSIYYRPICIREMTIRSSFNIYLTATVQDTLCKVTPMNKL